MNKRAEDLTEQEILESLLKIVKHHRTEFYKSQNTTDYTAFINDEIKKLLGEPE